MARAYEGPSEALAHYEAAIARLADVERKGAANPYTSFGGHMFSFLDKEGVVSIRLSEEDTDEFRSSHDSGDSVQYGRTMHGYSTVPHALLVRPEELAAWLVRSRAHVAALPPK